MLWYVNKQTVYRWMNFGKVVDGRIVRLQFYWVGGSKRIDPEMVAQFHEETNPQKQERKLTKKKETKLVSDAVEQARAWLKS